VTRDEQRLRDILEAINKIDRFAGEGRVAFDNDERTQVWMAHYVQIIGKAARALSEEFQAQHPRSHGLRSSGCATSSCTTTSELISVRSGPWSSEICRCSANRLKIS